jgi:hypothetical protein
MKFKVTNINSQIILFSQELEELHEFYKKIN